MKLFDLITQFHNWLSDKDFIWWPFSFLRPEANEAITFKTVIYMTLCFGGLASVMFTILAVVNNAFNPGDAFKTFMACFVGFFLWFTLVTKPLWNRRARVLQK